MEVQLTMHHRKSTSNYNHKINKFLLLIYILAYNAFSLSIQKLICSLA